MTNRFNPVEGLALTDPNSTINTTASPSWLSGAFGKEGWAMPAIQGFGSLANAWLGMRQLDLGRDTFDFNKDVFNKNYEQSLKDYNRQVADQTAARQAFHGQSPTAGLPVAAPAQLPQRLAEQDNPTSRYRSINV